MSIKIHPTAEVSAQAEIGDETSIWHFVHIREKAKIGRGCVIGRGVYVDTGVCIGDHVKIQNYVSVFHGVTIEDGVFIGPHVCFTNDLRPRAINPDGSLKSADDWQLSPTLIRYGAAIGANSTIVCGTTIGSWAMVGSGSVVTKDVPDYGLVWGNPARLHGFVCPCGTRVDTNQREHGVDSEDRITTNCPECGQSFQIERHVWENIQ